MKNNFWNLIESKVTKLCIEWICCDILATTRWKQEDINELIIGILNWNYTCIEELKKRWVEELNKTFN